MDVCDYSTISVILGKDVDTANDLSEGDKSNLYGILADRMTVFESRRDWLVNKTDPEDIDPLRDMVCLSLALYKPLLDECEVAGMDVSQQRTYLDKETKNLRKLGHLRNDSPTVEENLAQLGRGLKAIIEDPSITSKAEDEINRIKSKYSCN